MTQTHHADNIHINQISLNMSYSYTQKNGEVKRFIVFWTNHFPCVKNHEQWSRKEWLEVSRQVTLRSYESRREGSDFPGSGTGHRRVAVPAAESGGVLHGAAALMLHAIRKFI
jgi:hypothetical protein